MTLQELKISYPHIHSVVEQLKTHPFYGQEDFFTQIENGLPLETILDFLNNAGYEVKYSLSLRKRQMTMYDVVVVDCLFAIEKYDEANRKDLIRLASMFLNKSSFLGEERSALRTWMGFIERAKDGFDKDYYFYSQPYCLKHIIDDSITAFWDLEYFQANSIVLNYDKAQMILYVPGFFETGKKAQTETVQNLYSYAEYGRFGVTKNFQYV